ncbi:MAG: hypothetical protein QHH04_06585 [Methanolinea sp.]|jgi:hypothetical protein|nr:hypothetical protein [Methanolinea sp.]
MSREQVFISVIIVFLLSWTCCCIEVGSQEPGGSPSAPPQPSAPGPQAQPVPPFIPGGPGVPAAPPAVPVTSSPGTTVAGTAVYTEPIPPAIAANFSFRDIPLAPDSFPRPFDYPTAPFFSGTYQLEWNNVALLAQPSDPPFIIEMGFVAGTKNPYDARAIVTVRDNRTGEIIAEDGYNGEFSSEKEKLICIREIGDYHINVYGYRTTVYLVLREGVDESRAVPYGIFEKPQEQVSIDEQFEEEYF